ncbi:peptidase M14 [Bacillus sp. FJAT-42376]|uniref:M14 family metallopeptidase n=1 Tax=Bacillus sp. FJAT-42376 TaxID=2014076 RepID=UPI000F4EBAD8|nr:M14 family metallocarboxypeptidase [Bacillus sp. FJAT-42376]AZB43614.1 peptidase M14 [Bacillus sp. FJAT-42376]
MKIKVRKHVRISDLAAHFQIDAVLIEQSNPPLPEWIPSSSIIDIPGYEWVTADEPFPDLYEPDIPMTGKGKAMKVSDDISLRKTEYTSSCFYRDIEKMVLKYPFIRTRIIGNTIRKKPIIEITIGTGARTVHMNASFHANEWITSAVLMDWLEQYANDLVHGKKRYGHPSLQLYTHNSLSIVPMVNPDGVDLVLEGLPEEDNLRKLVLQLNQQSQDFSQWKANIRGVDLNNQYPAYWEIEKERKIPKSPASRDYPGDKPLSEPESIAMAALSQEKEFDRLLCFHTQGEEIYWGYLNKEPEESALIVKEFSILSGYAAVRNIDSHAGYRDWFIHERGRPGYTIELGLGENPLPLDQYNDIRQKGEGIFWAALYM